MCARAFGGGLGGKKCKCETRKRYLMLSAKYLLQSAKENSHHITKFKARADPNTYNRGKYVLQRQIRITEAHNFLQKAHTFLLLSLL